MDIKKIIHTLNKYCALALTVTILSGCSTPEKKQQLLSLQKRRILKLEKQVTKQTKYIDKLKAQKWTNKPVRVGEKLALRRLKKIMRQKKWVKALKLSSRIKKRYPKSRTLAKYRYVIFSKMGLTKQADSENRRFRKLQANRDRERIVK